MSSSTSSSITVGPEDPTVGSDVQPIARPVWPARIGPYEVRGELGRGGMGVVLRGHDEALGRDVALKVLHPAWAGLEERRRLELEAKAAARLEHPHVVRVLAAGQDEALAWLAMELVPGETLRARIAREGPLAPRAAAELGVALASALEHAHGRSVLHRDVKPGNVLLSPTGPKLCDFGLAKSLDIEAVGPSHSGQVLGTPSYLAPEQADGRGEDLGPWTDVWGVGATLYEALAGRPPFSASSVVALLAATLKKDPTPPSALRGDVDARLEAIVLRCLEKAPARRYATAGALEEDLRAWLAGGTTVARRPRASDRAWRAVRRRPTAALAALAVVTALGAAAWSWRAGAPDRARARALAALDEAAAAARTGAATEDVARAIERALAGLPVAGGPGDAPVLLAAARAYEAAGDARVDALLDLAAAADDGPAGDEALLWAHRRALARDGRGAHLTPPLEEVLRRTAARGASPVADLARAEGLRAGGDVVAAEAALDAAIVQAPRLPWARLLRAELREARGDEAAAREDLDAALATEPTLVAALLRRANLALERGAATPALADLERAVAAAPASAEARYGRARARLALDDPSGAGLDLARAVELDPELAPAWALRGTLRGSQGEVDLARSDLATALELDPEQAAWWHERAVLDLAADDPRAARDAASRALALDPTLRAAWRLRAEARQALGDAEGASADREAARALDR